MFLPICKGGGGGRGRFGCAVGLAPLVKIRGVERMRVVDIQSNAAQCECNVKTIKKAAALIAV
jgi:hypothetical protein